MNNTSELLFENAIGKIAQVCNSYDIFLEIDQESMRISIKELIRIRSIINQVDIIQAIHDLSDYFDTMKVVLKPKSSPNKTQHYTLCQFIGIKNLFNGAYFSIELQDILSRRGITLNKHYYALNEQLMAFN